MGPSKPKAKTKTFTGCWTCRARKVKCDLGRPHCHRCTRAGKPCQGYAIPLYWVQDDQDVAPSAIRRQAMGLALGSPHWPKGVVGDIDQHLRDIEAAAWHGSCQSAVSGPFGVLCLTYPETDPGSKSPPSNLIIPPTGDDTHCSTTEEQMLSQSDEALTVQLLEADRVTLSDAAEKDSPPPSHSHPTFGSTISSHLDAVSQHDALISGLMGHYIQNVATILQPVLHPRNAYSSIYGSKAMSVAQRMSWRDVIRQMKVSDSKLALLYSLLTSSSFHIGGHDRSANADAMARRFRIEAGSHLRAAIASLPRGDDSSDKSSLAVHSKSLGRCEGVLTVMLTLVTADVLDGHMNEFWIHLDAARDLVQRLRDQARPKSTTEHLINISSFLRVLSDSTDVSMPPLPWSPDATGGEASFFLGGGHSLEYTYGITARLADFLCRASQLARHAAYYRSSDCPPPSGFTAACRRLLSDMAHWDISQEPLPSFSDSDQVTRLLASKHMQAFAQGIRIYFHTRVVTCDTPTVTGLVQSASSLLASIETIKRRTGYDATPTATISWPGFVASCQAAPGCRDVWVRWWQQMLDYRIGNIRVLWSVVQEAWALPEACAELEPPWAVVLRRTGRRILAI